jgi:hypothetical protein
MANLLSHCVAAMATYGLLAASLRHPPVAAATFFAGLLALLLARKGDGLPPSPRRRGVHVAVLAPAFLLPLAWGGLVVEGFLVLAAALGSFFGLRGAVAWIATRSLNPALRRDDDPVVNLAIALPALTAVVAFLAL